MIAEIVARRYAKAFLNSVAASEYPTVFVELQKLDALIASNKQLRDALFHPTLSKLKKAGILTAVFDVAKPAAKVAAFCRAIVEHGRIIMYPVIVKEIEREWERRQRIIEVEIRSAVPLKSAQRARLESELSRLAGGTLKPVYKLDDRVVAGVVTRIGTTFYDGSLQSQLRRIRESLIGK